MQWSINRHSRIFNAIQDSNASVAVLQQRIADGDEALIHRWLSDALRVAARGPDTPLNRDKFALLLNHPSMSKQMIDGTYDYRTTSAIRCAAKAGNITALKMLLADKRVDRHSIAKDQSLMDASYNALQVLLKDDRVDYDLLHEVDACSRTILMGVVQRTDYDSLKLLLSDERVDEKLLSKVDNYGKTVLHHVVYVFRDTRLTVARTHYAMTKLLLDHPHMTQQCFDITDEVGRTVLMHAIATPYPNHEIVRLLLQDNKMTREHFRRKDRHGKTTLMWAAISSESAEIMRLILEHPYMDKKLIDACEKKTGMTALMCLAWRAVDSVTQACVSAMLADPRVDEASLSKRDELGWAFIHYVANQGNAVFMKHLLAHPCMDIKLVSDETMHGNTALTLAASSGHTEIVKLLLGDHRVDGFYVHHRIRFANEAALTFAINGRHTDVVTLLLRDHRTTIADLEWYLQDGNTKSHLDMAKFVQEELDRRVSEQLLAIFPSSNASLWPKRGHDDTADAMQQPCGLLDSFHKSDMLEPHVLKIIREFAKY
jgi:ankyrin repeat protein